MSTKLSPPPRLSDGMCLVARSDKRPTQIGQVRITLPAVNKCLADHSNSVLVILALPSFATVVLSLTSLRPNSITSSESVTLIP